MIDLTFASGLDVARDSARKLILTAISTTSTSRLGVTTALSKLAPIQGREGNLSRARIICVGT